MTLVREWRISSEETAPVREWREKMTAPVREWREKMLEP
jgi:hypothetical protein